MSGVPSDVPAVETKIPVQASRGDTSDDDKSVSSRDSSSTHRNTKGEKLKKRSATKSKAQKAVLDVIVNEQAAVQGAHDAQVQRATEDVEDEKGKEKPALEDVRCDVNNFTVRLNPLPIIFKQMAGFLPQYAKYEDHMAKRQWNRVQSMHAPDEDMRPMHNLGHKMYRPGATVSEWELIQDERLSVPKGINSSNLMSLLDIATWEKSCERKMFVCECVAMDILSKYGARACALGPRINIETYYDLVAIGTNVDVRFPTLKDDTIEFVRDFARSRLGERMVEDWDFHDAPQSAGDSRLPTGIVAASSAVLVNTTKHALAWICTLLIACLAVTLVVFLSVSTLLVLPCLPLTRTIMKRWLAALVSVLAVWFQNAILGYCEILGHLFVHGLGEIWTLWIRKPIYHLHRGCRRPIILIGEKINFGERLVNVAASCTRAISITSRLLREKAIIPKMYATKKLEQLIRAVTRLSVYLARYFTR